MSKRTELEAKGYKTYENDEIAVFWNPTVCQHAGKCVQGNADVFDPKRRPWVDLSQASGKEIAAIIDNCPSGALQYELKEQITVVFEPERKRSAAYIDGKHVGECEYSDSGTVWVIAHTGVEPCYEGRGIARKLVNKVVEAAREKHVRIIPLCPYAKKLLTGKAEYSDVLG